MTLTPVEARDRVIALLSPDHPMPETDLYRLLREELDREEIKTAVATCLMRNEIRWVAFQGYCRGGRPGA